MNLTTLLEFGMEKSRSDQIVHFLSDPPFPLEWTDIYPSDRQFAQLKRVPKNREVKIREIVFKTERVYGFLSGI